MHSASVSGVQTSTSMPTLRSLPAVVLLYSGRALEPSAPRPIIRMPDWAMAWTCFTRSRSSRRRRRIGIVLPERFELIGVANLHGLALPLVAAFRLGLYFRFRCFLGHRRIPCAQQVK